MEIKMLFSFAIVEMELDLPRFLITFAVEFVST